MVWVTSTVPSPLVSTWTWVPGCDAWMNRPVYALAFVVPDGTAVFCPTGTTKSVPYLVVS